ncbi:MAG: GNAT family N-acetyltransferase, partial [bacterium]|nr:GNAT family N-acetyltransferase [bacterium]
MCAAGHDVTTDDVAALTVCRAMRDVPAGVALFLRRMAGGSRCVGLWHATGLAGYAWAHPHENVREDRDQYHLPLGADGACIYDTFIQPAWRGQALYSLLLAALQQDCAADGLTRFFLTVDTANVRSQRAHEKAGAQWRETVWYLCCAGVTRH